MPTTTAITTLSIRYNNLGGISPIGDTSTGTLTTDSGLAALLSALRENSTLTNIDLLCSHDMDARTCDAVVDVALLKVDSGLITFEQVELPVLLICSHCALDQVECIEAPAFAVAMRVLQSNHQLVYLNLTHVEGLETLDWQPLVELIRSSPSLRTLDFRGNSLVENFMSSEEKNRVILHSEALALAVLCNSRIVRFSNIPLVTREACGWTLAPPSDGELIDLDLTPGANGPKYGYAEVLVLAGVLHPGSYRYNPNIRSVDLRGNFLTDEAGAILEQAILGSPNLSSVNLLDNIFSPEFATRLLWVCARAVCPDHFGVSYRNNLGYPKFEQPHEAPSQCTKSPTLLRLSDVLCSMEGRIALAALAKPFASLFISPLSHRERDTVSQRVVSREVHLLESELSHDPEIPAGAFDAVIADDPERAAKWCSLVQLLRAHAETTFLTLPHDLEHDYMAYADVEMLLEIPSHWCERSQCLRSQWPEHACKLRSLCGLESTHEQRLKIEMKNDSYASAANLILLAAELRSVTSLDFSGSSHITHTPPWPRRVWDPIGVQAILKALRNSSVTHLDLSGTDLCGVTNRLSQYSTACLETLSQVLFGASLQEADHEVTRNSGYHRIKVTFRALGTNEESVPQFVEPDWSVEHLILAFCAMKRIVPAGYFFWLGLRQIALNDSACGFYPNLSMTFRSLCFPPEGVIEYVPRSRSCELPLRCLR